LDEEMLGEDFGGEEDSGGEFTGEVEAEAPAPPPPASPPKKKEETSTTTTTSVTTKSPVKDKPTGCK